jgi:hypothetical protein
MSRFNSFVCIKKSLKIPKIISQKWALQNMTKKIISQKWTLQNMTKKKNNHQQIRLHRKLKIK